MKDKYFILLIAFFIMFLIISSVKKIKRKDKFIAAGSRQCNKAIFFIAIIWLLLVISCFTTFFIEDFKQAKLLLVPKYINHWTGLFFHHDDLISLANMFSQNKMSSEAITVYMYAGYGLDQFYNGIIIALMGIVWLTRSFSKNIICSDGIYISGIYYKLENIKDYEWGELQCKQSKKGNLEYYCLKIQVCRKIFKFLDEEVSEIEMKINAEDKEKVEELLLSRRV